MNRVIFYIIWVAIGLSLIGTVAVVGLRIHFALIDMEICQRVDHSVIKPEGFCEQ